jgi:hypothetical protein
MPDQLPSDIQTGYSAQTAFDIKMDTARTLSSVLDRPDNPVSINYPSAAPTPSATQGLPTYQAPPDISVGQALISKDPKIKQLAQQTLTSAAARDPYTLLGVGTEIRTPYAQAEKYMDKQFGYDALNPDTEDFYYRNDYMADGFLKRQLKNVGKFTSRVAVGAIDKLGEGFGYLGSAAFNAIQEPISAAITGKPTHFWADVADNAFSKLMQDADQGFRDRITPVYKKAGFDEKGFFSKLGDATFWNDSVADGVAFMASAMIPMGIASKAGLLVKGADLFGEASSLARGANAATKFITGGESWGEVAMSAFNTVNEAAFEAAGRYKDAVQELQDARAKGQNNLTDEQIQSKAGSEASSTFGWNTLALTASNAWEMKHIFKPIVGGGVKRTEANAADILINETGEAGLKKYSLGLLNTRVGKAVPYYVKKGLGATIAEGFWEENIQNAIQRANAGSYNRKGDNTGPLGVNETTHSGFYGILEQYGRQTIDALKGNDRENAESIGLGGVIGIAGGSGKLGYRYNPETEKMSFFLGERRAEEAANRVRVAAINNAYNARMTVEDLKNPDGTIDKAKLKAKMDAFQNFSARQHVLNQLKEEGTLPKHEVQMLENRLLNDYARGLARVGKLDEAIKRFEELATKAPKPGEKAVSSPIATASYLTDLKNLYETIQNRRIQDKVPQGMSREDVAIYNQSRKDRAFDLLADRKAMQPTLDFMQEGITSQFQQLQNFSASSFLNEQVNKELAKGRATDYIQHHAQKAFYEARLKAEQNAPEFIKAFYQAKVKEANDQIKQIDEFLKEDKPEVKDGLPHYPDAIQRLARPAEPVQRQLRSPGCDGAPPKSKRFYCRSHSPSHYGTGTLRPIPGLYRFCYTG